MDQVTRSKNTRTCQCCGKLFFSTYNSKRKGMTVLCSRSCSGHATGKKVEIVCQMCGVTVLRSPSRNGGKFCSHHCVRNSIRVNGSPNRKPGRNVSKNGYVYVFVGHHPLYKDKRRPDGKPWSTDLEHRVVMAELLGRPLHSWENVHHKNGVRDDNRPENLELWIKPQAAGCRLEDVYGSELVEARREIVHLSNLLKAYERSDHEMAV